jgi:hypothetical protein
MIWVNSQVVRPLEIYLLAGTLRPVMGSRTVFVVLVAFGLVGTLTGVVVASDHGGCLYVYTDDHDGDDAETAIVVTGDDYSQLYYTHERGDAGACEAVTVDNGVPFATPGGDVTVYVFGGPDYNYQWGVFETSVPATGPEYVSFRRGGVYSTAATLRPAADAYEPGDIVDLEFDLFNGQDVSGADVTVEVYVYPEAESRPSDPVATTTATDLGANSPETVTVSAELPEATGTYRVDAELHTAYAIVEDYRYLTDAVAVDTIELSDGVVPPEFTAVEPEPGEHYLDPDETARFEVAVTDETNPDDEIALDWYLDGEPVGSGPTFHLDAAEYGPGTYRLEVVASDEHDASESATARWEVQIVGPPAVVGIRMDGTALNDSETVELGTHAQAEFAVSVRDPNVPAEELDIRWEVDGHEVGTGERFVFNASQFVYGRHRVRVVATDEFDERQTATAEWTVAVASTPEIREAVPSARRVTSRSGEAVTFRAEAVDGRGEAVTYEWFLDGTPVAAGPEHTLRFDQSGRYAVELRVSNEAGMATNRQWDVVVERFTEAPTVALRDASGGFAVAFQHAGTNERAAAMELHLDVPAAVSVRSPQGVEQRAPGGYVTALELDPGDATEVVIEIDANASLVGERVPVEYVVRAAPVPAPDDGTTLLDGRIELAVVGGEPSTDGGPFGPDSPVQNEVFTLAVASALLALLLTYLRDVA